MIKTYREVLRDIQPGEIWECIEEGLIKAIRYHEDETISIEYTTFSQSGIFCVNANRKFKLKKNEVEFEDAIKALKEGKTIESCETFCLYKIKRRGNDKDTILSGKQNSSTWLDLSCNFETKEVFGKWCIYNEGEI